MASSADSSPGLPDSLLVGLPCAAAFWVSESPNRRASKWLHAPYRGHQGGEVLYSANQGRLDLKRCLACARGRASPQHLHCGARKGPRGGYHIERPPAFLYTVPYHHKGAMFAGPLLDRGPDGGRWVLGPQCPPPPPSRVSVSLCHPCRGALLCSQFSPSHSGDSIQQLWMCVDYQGLPLPQSYGVANCRWVWLLVAAPARPLMGRPIGWLLLGPCSYAELS